MDLSDFTDYLPNVFGYAPSGIEGLLGADKTAELNKQANVSGLLGAAMGLATGMGAGGYRRSAAQNILGAIGAGVGASQGQYQGAVDLMGEQSKIAKAQFEQMQQLRKLQSIEQLAANNTKFADIIRIDPVRGLELASADADQSNIQSVYKDIQGRRTKLNEQQMPPVQPPVLDQNGMIESKMVDGQWQLPPNAITSNIDPMTRLIHERNDLIDWNAGIAGLRGSDKQIKLNNERIDAIRKQIGDMAPEQFDFDAFKNTIWTRFQPELQQIKNAAISGLLPGEKLFDALSDLKKRSDTYVREQTDFTNDVRRVAKEMFPDTPLYALDEKQAGQLNARLLKDKLATNNASASKTNIYTGDLSKTTQSKVEDQVLSMGDAITRLNDIQATYRPEYQNIKFKFGQSWASIKDKFGILPPADKNTLAAYSVYKQNATQNLNQTIKDLTGSAMGESEAKRIMSTLPDAGQDAWSGDSPTEFEAKLNNAIAQTKYAIARKNYALKNGLKWQEIPLDSMPNRINQRGAQIAKEYNLDPKKQADLTTINRQLSAEFGINF